MPRIFLIALVLLTAALAFLCLRAPKGEEDETGFHPEPGSPPENPERESSISRSPDAKQ